MEKPARGGFFHSQVGSCAGGTPDFPARGVEIRDILDPPTRVYRAFHEVLEQPLAFAAIV